MKLSEIKNMQRKPELGLGSHDVIFDKIQYRTDANMEINGVFVHIKDYKSLFIPFFEQDNFQLDLLLEQLGCTSYDPDEINQYTGTVIKVNRYQRETDNGPTYTNTSFNPRGQEAIDTLA